MADEDTLKTYLNFIINILNGVSGGLYTKIDSVVPAVGKVLNTAIAGLEDFENVALGNVQTHLDGKIADTKSAVQDVGRNVTAVQNSVNNVVIPMLDEVQGTQDYHTALLNQLIGNTTGLGTEIADAFKDSISSLTNNIDYTLNQNTKDIVDAISSLKTDYTQQFVLISNQIRDSINTLGNNITRSNTSMINSLNTELTSVSNGLLTKLGTFDTDVKTLLTAIENTFTGFNDNLIIFLSHYWENVDSRTSKEKESLIVEEGNVQGLLERVRSVGLNGMPPITGI